MRGRRGPRGSFIGQLLSDILFVDVEQSKLNLIYLAFFGIVLLGFWGAPPRRRIRGESP